MFLIILFNCFYYLIFMYIVSYLSAAALNKSPQYESDEEDDEDELFNNKINIKEYLNEKEYDEENEDGLGFAEVIILVIYLNFF